MAELKLKQVKAFTIYSSDSERSASEKGLYKDYGVASIRAKGHGWCGADGEVKEKKDIYQDESGELYRVHKVGNFIDVEEEYKEKIIQSIKAKLTKEELEMLGLQDQTKPETK